MKIKENHDLQVLINIFLLILSNIYLLYIILFILNASIPFFNED